MSAFTPQWTWVAALRLLGSEVTGRISRSDTAGAPWPSELKAKLCSCYILSLFFTSVPAFPSFFPFFWAGKQKTGKEDRGILSEGWGKGQVTLADRLKYHSLPGARHRLWCSKGICDKSGVILRERSTTAASKKPPVRKIDQVLLTESLTVGKSSSLKLCSQISFEGSIRKSRRSLGLLFLQVLEDLILS